MTSDPLISIITPVYNQERFIEQTIRSVLGQTYQNWEWIIIDDGSTDRTREIVLSFQDKRIQYTHQEHGGIDELCFIHNRAFNLSRGAFIALIDSDDLWPDYKLDRQVKSFVHDDIVLSYGECCLINAKGEKIDYVKIPPKNDVAMNDPVGMSLREFLLNANSFIYNPTVLIRRTALEKIGGFITYKGLAHDFPTWCRLSLEGNFTPLPLCLGYWRKHSGSLTFHHAEYRFMNKIKFIKDFIALHKKTIDSLMTDFTKDNINTHLEKRYHSFIKHFPYDRAMLMAEIGIFQEAKREFANFLQRNYSLKNICISYLFSLSGLLRYDLVNPIRKLKEKFVAQ